MIAKTRSIYCSFVFPIQNGGKLKLNSRLTSIGYYFGQGSHL